MTAAADDYRLLDSGQGRKLEQVGPLRLDRPAPPAVWRPRLPPSAWADPDGRYERDAQGTGRWHWRAGEPAPFAVELAGLRLWVKPTPFGHLGLFAEQAPQWPWLRAQAAAAPGLRVLNLFAYTGAATLAAAAGGAAVTHVDASRPVVQWARENAAPAGLADAPIRWLADDVRKFLARELRRGSRYDGLILDPPTFGRGPRQEVWKIDQHLDETLDRCRRLLSEAPRFVLLSAHSPGYSPLVLDNLLAQAAPGGGRREFGEMTVPEADGVRLLPAGAFARWRAGD